MENSLSRTVKGSPEASPSMEACIPTGTPVRAVTLHTVLSPLPNMPAKIRTYSEMCAAVLAMLRKGKRQDPFLQCLPIWTMETASETDLIPSDVMKWKRIRQKGHEEDIRVKPRPPVNPSCEPS